MAEIRVVERKNSVWRWLIPALIALALLWMLLSRRGDRTEGTSGGAVTDSAVVAPDNSATGTGIGAGSAAGTGTGPGAGTGTP